MDKQIVYTFGVFVFFMLLTAFLPNILKYDEKYTIHFPTALEDKDYNSIFLNVCTLYQDCLTIGGIKYYRAQNKNSVFSDRRMIFWKKSDQKKIKIYLRDKQKKIENKLYTKIYIKSGTNNYIKFIKM